MARPILIYGHPAAGKSYAFKTLNPDTTVILDVDNKGALPWRGCAKFYNAQRNNFFSIDTLDRIIKAIKKIDADDAFKHVTVLGVDGFNNALVNEQCFYDEWHNPKNPYEKYSELSRKTKLIFRLAQNMRKDLTVVFTAHVECADPYKPNDIDHLLTPGKQLKEQFRIEGNFLYVFYAKVGKDGNHFFETIPVNSSVRAPEGCFPPTIPNDLKAIIETITAYENGVDSND